MCQTRYVTSCRLRRTCCVTTRHALCVMRQRFFKLGDVRSFSALTLKFHHWVRRQKSHCASPMRKRFTSSVSASALACWCVQGGITRGLIQTRCVKNCMFFTTHRALRVATMLSPETQGHGTKQRVDSHRHEPTDLC